MFGKSKSKTQTIQTIIGEGESSQDPKLGEVLEVSRYHRGSVIEYTWPSKLSSTDQVIEVATSIQSYIDIALDIIDEDKAFRNDILKQGGIYPMNVYWGRDDCDFSISFAYVGWDDGILRFFFRGKTIIDTDISD